ncbi:hypothetical protein FZI95_28135 [Mycobacterium sp. CBMA247]|nr:hypothetical protein [Mycolicibacterium sp. CBMA 329]MUL90712.1 hypothetical protein [Mycolicibacterium sp. CBMA 331]MUM00681.1 hypothetical protein [Mycolicibacterium sp. CBMA 334]MUM29852.1 hypothetical protein [Mycolicibacterium sp. CBMA 295]MUM41656.1 hypothetical protein [Mycolicibacterium sp. CBMA 247]MUM46120.1 hypothetical protein [Mycolicibacterium sp. CBMA 294]
MVVTFCRRGDDGGPATTAGRSAVARVASWSAMAVPPPRPRFGAAMVLRAVPRQSWQSITSGRVLIEYIFFVTPQPESQRNS